MVEHGRYKELNLMHIIIINSIVGLFVSNNYSAVLVHWIFHNFPQLVSDSLTSAGVEKKGVILLVL